ncbi:transglutaminase-like domain-containing protein [Patescibacteria group bacterium]|nr:transglutaminase-like domain-containing protein [Patescibacteria group bacterium]
MTEENKKYLKFGKYTANCSEELLGKIKTLNLDKVDKDTVHKIFKLIRQEFDPRLHKVEIVNDLAKSRFISAKDLYSKRQYSCGSLATLVASILRTLGVPNKLIDGKYIKDNPNMRHAWNEVYLLDQGKFVAFDITKPGFSLSKYHIKEGEYIDWEDLEI